jgi:hypothetical protein
VDVGFIPGGFARFRGGLVARGRGWGGGGGGGRSRRAGPARGM